MCVALKNPSVLHQKGERPVCQGDFRQTLQEAWEQYRFSLYQNDQASHEPGAEPTVWDPAIGADGGQPFPRISGGGS